MTFSSNQVRLLLLSSQGGSITRVVKRTTFFVRQIFILQHVRVPVRLILVIVLLSHFHCAHSSATCLENVLLHLQKQFSPLLLLCECTFITLKRQVDWTSLYSWFVYNLLLFRQAAMDISARYCQKELEAYGSCVASNPSKWQQMCHELKMKVAKCTSSQ